MNTEQADRPEPITTKRQFVRLYARGCLGNAAPTWMTLEAFLAEQPPYKGLVHIRNRVAGGPTWYDVPSAFVFGLWHKILDSGTDAASLYLSGMAPHDRQTLQGEVQRTAQGLYLLGTFVKRPMREALAESRFHVYGLAAKGLLDRYMDPVSRDWLDELLRLYDGHIVEFSCFTVPVGTLRWNTIYWECRAY